MELHCSRAKSRAGRKLIENLMRLTPGTDQELMPDSCPLRLENDVFAAQESGKVRQHKSLWSCPLCAKRFRTEFYLDRHLDNKHSHDLDAKTGCLADLCEVFNCENSSLSTPACSSAQEARARHKCHSIFHRCFPHSTHIDAHDDHFIDNICDTLECKGGTLYVQKATHGRSHKSLAWSVLMVLAVVCLSAVYIVLLLIWKHTSTKSDLRHYSKRKTSWVGGIFSRMRSKRDWLIDSGILFWHDFSGRRLKVWRKRSAVIQYALHTDTQLLAQSKHFTRSFCLKLSVLKVHASSQAH